MLGILAKVSYPQNSEILRKKIISQGIPEQLEPHGAPPRQLTGLRLEEQGDSVRAGPTSLQIDSRVDDSEIKSSSSASSTLIVHTVLSNSSHLDAERVDSYRFSALTSARLHLASVSRSHAACSKPLSVVRQMP